MGTDKTASLRGGRTPHVMLAVGHRHTRPDDFGALLPPGWKFSRIDLHDLHKSCLADVDVLVIPDTHDQVYLKSIESSLVAYLASGGHMLVNGHITLPWLPYLSPFIAVSSRPHTNWMIRPAYPGAYFGRMDFEVFHVWDGVLGQYARGYSLPPAGAQALCLIGAGTNDGPCDWVWRAPGGGKLFMHNGDDIEAFCSDPHREPNLFQDILWALVFSNEPAQIEEEQLHTALLDGQNSSAAVVKKASRTKTPSAAACHPPLASLI